MTQHIVDPATIGRRSRLDPLRCYLSLRRVVEPHWYRRAWESDPWTVFQNGDCPQIRIECSQEAQALLRKLDQVLSAVNHEQTQVLYWLARHAPAMGDIVEIGSDQGKSTIALSLGAARNKSACTVHAVDPFIAGVSHTSAQRIEIFKTNLARFGASGVTMHRMFSGEYRRERHEPVRLLFVDAAHDYLNSSYDFLSWKELISRGGYIAAHDVDNYDHGPGTRKAFIDCVLRDPGYRLVYHVDNLAVAQRICGAV